MILLDRFITRLFDALRGKAQADAAVTVVDTLAPYVAAVLVVWILARYFGSPPAPPAAAPAAC